MMFVTQSSVCSDNAKKEEILSRTIIHMKDDNDDLKSIMTETNSGRKALAKEIIHLNNKFLKPAHLKN